LPGEKVKETMETEICKILDRIGAIKFGAFKLTSGKFSPYYIDLRIVPSFPDAFQRILESYVSFIEKEVGIECVDRVAGIPVAGIPFASVIAYRLKKPFLYFRKGEPLHGRQRRIEGVIAPGNRILLIDDLIASGLSLQKAARAIISEGGVITDAVVLLDRQEGGRKKLMKNKIELHSMLDVSRIAATLHELGTIDDEQLKTILKQVKK
jgi:orotate phosphoribosyltransferase